MTHPTPLTLGLDVSDKHTHICALDEHGEIVFEDRVATKEVALSQRLAKLPQARIVLEVGRQSPWMSRLFSRLGHEVIVANPRKVSLIYNNPTKNDRLDAQRLARLGRIDPELLSPIQHHREDTQATLAILRTRETVVGARTALINTVRGQVKSMGGKMPGGRTETFHRQWEAVPEPLHAALKPVFELIEQLTQQIHHYDRLLEELANEVYPETELLRQVWGVGSITALAFVLTIEDPERFPNSRAVGSDFGLRPRQDQSGEVDKQLPITKAGDPLVRKLLVQCAHRILSERGPDCDLKRWGLRLAERGGRAAKKRAVIAVARKLAVLLHRLWQGALAYDPLHAESQKNAA